MAHGLDLKKNIRPIFKQYPVPLCPINYTYYKLTDDSLES